MKSQIAAQGRVLPNYHGGKATVDALQLSRNKAAHDSLKNVNALMHTMKGGDYAKIKPYADDLRHLAKLSPIDGKIRTFLGESAEKFVVSQGKEQIAKGEQYVKDNIDKWILSKEKPHTVPSSSSYRCALVGV